MTDEQIKQYFLGNPATAEAEAFEEQIASDAELTNHAQMIENELVDDYLRNNLALDERNLFEKNYLITESRHQKLRIAESLWKVANEAKIETVTTEPKVSFWQSWNALRWATAGLTAFILLTIGIFMWRNAPDKPEIVRQGNNNQSPTPKIENQNIQINQNAAPSPNSNLNSGNSDSQNNANTKKISPTPTPKTTPTPKLIEPPAPTLATFVLLPGTLRDEGEQFIKITPNINKVNLRLNLPKDANKYQTYTATVKTADGETIFTAPNLKSLNLTLPVNKFSNKTYIVFLEGNNAQKPAESVAEYTFRVRR